MTLDRDPLVWLLPDAPRRQERAQSLVTGLRLLRSAGRGVASPSVGISGPRARHELERRSNDAHTSALEDLLRHHLGAAQDADAVLWFGWPRLSTDRAWRRLLETPRRGGTSSPEPPAPAENPLDVAERLIRGAEWAPARTAFWQARSAWVRSRPIPNGRWRSRSTVRLRNSNVATCGALWPTWGSPGSRNIPAVDASRRGARSRSAERPPAPMRCWIRPRAVRFPPDCSPGAANVVPGPGS